MDTCKYCRFYLPDGKQTYGTCRRYPALPVVTIDRTGSSGGYDCSSTIDFRQPVMGEAEWCGEFEYSAKPSK
jgi:hypothetical protein